MEQRTPSGRKPSSNSYLQYSNFAIQLFGGMAIAGWVGYRLDQYLELSFPVFLLSFLLAVFAGMLYQMYKKLNRD